MYYNIRIIDPNLVHINKTNCYELVLKKKRGTFHYGI